MFAPAAARGRYNVFVIADSANGRLRERQRSRTTPARRGTPLDVMPIPYADLKLTERRRCRRPRSPAALLEVTWTVRNDGIGRTDLAQLVRPGHHRAQSRRHRCHRERGLRPHRRARSRRQLCAHRQRAVAERAVRAGLRDGAHRRPVRIHLQRRPQQRSRRAGAGEPVAVARPRRDGRSARPPPPTRATPSTSPGRCATTAQRARNGSWTDTIVPAQAGLRPGGSDDAAADRARHVHLHRRARRRDRSTRAPSGSRCRRGSKAPGRSASPPTASNTAVRGQPGACEQHDVRRRR